jgi:hypothetical protein
VVTIETNVEKKKGFRLFASKKGFWAQINDGVVGVATAAIILVFVFLLLAYVKSTSFATAETNNTIDKITTALNIYPDLAIPLLILVSVFGLVIAGMYFYQRFTSGGGRAN